MAFWKGHIDPTPNPANYLFKKAARKLPFCIYKSNRNMQISLFLFINNMLYFLTKCRLKNRRKYIFDFPIFGLSRDSNNSSSAIWNPLLLTLSFLDTSVFHGWITGQPLKSGKQALSATCPVCMPDRRFPSHANSRRHKSSLGPTG